MKDRPDESRLIAYLYGDMSKEETREMEVYLREHPEVAAELEDLGGVREMMRKWTDQEVAEPTFIIPGNQRSSLYISRRWIGIAATLLLLIVAGYATNFTMQYDQEGFRLGFGTSNTDTFTKEEVNRLLESTLSQYDDKLNQRLEGFKGDINQSLATASESNDQKINEAYTKLLNVSQRQIASYVSQMDRQQKENIDGLMAMNQEQQQLYMNNLLTDFTTYLEQQRKSDLEDIETYLTSMQRTTDQKLMETDQVLASIITQVSTQPISD